MINEVENQTIKKSSSKKGNHTYYGHGKILITGEYFILDGAKGLAIPTRYGQNLNVSYRPSFNPKLNWKSKDSNGNVWLEADFEFWHFDLLSTEKPSKEVLFLQKLLRQARVQNRHFLRDEVDVMVETNLEFPLNWGLGSSSTLIYNIAQWAYISPFELMFKCLNGSGYDVACAGGQGPIIYQRSGTNPTWSFVQFNPPFKDKLYFIHLGKKQSTLKAIKHYKGLRPFKKEIYEKINSITDEIVNLSDFKRFEELIREHEHILSINLDLPPVKMLHFSDYWGEIKSLGAWGGDFIMATSDRSEKETLQYFNEKGLTTILNFDQLLFSPIESEDHPLNDLAVKK